MPFATNRMYPMKPGAAKTGKLRQLWSLRVSDRKIGVKGVGVSSQTAIYKGRSAVVCGR